MIANHKDCYEHPYGPKTLCTAKGPNIAFDDDVQSTLQEAMLSKFSAVSFGYYEDNYIKYFVSSFHRRIPLVNRGYYSRVAAMRKVMMNFIDFSPIGKIQILSLGAGFDTSFWYLRDVLKCQKFENLLNRELKFIEIDFPNVMSQKSSIIGRNPVLHDEFADFQIYSNPKVSSDSEPAVFVDSCSYACIGADLSVPENLAKLDKLLEQVKFDRSLPTLFLFECVLIYLTPEEGDRILTWVSGLSNTIGVSAMYQQIRPNDCFGKVMLDHMERKKCPLKSIKSYPDIDDQVSRLRKCCFNLATCKDLNFIYDFCLEKSEIMRIQQLELFDEIEEWRLINSHYCVSIGVACSPEYQDYGNDFVTMWKPVDIKPLYFSGDDVRKAKSQSSLVSLASHHCEVQEEAMRYNRLVMSASYKSLHQLRSDSNSNSQVDVMNSSLHKVEDSDKSLASRNSLVNKMVDSLQEDHNALLDPSDLNKRTPSKHGDSRKTLDSVNEDGEYSVSVDVTSNRSSAGAPVDH